MGESDTETGSDLESESDTESGSSASYLLDSTSPDAPYTELRYCEKLKLLSNPANNHLSESIIDSEPLDVFDLQSSFSLSEFRQLLTDHGMHIKRLRLDTSSSEEYSLAYLNLLSEYCTNLREICVASVEITTTNEFGQILNSAQNTIEKLTLIKCIVWEPACLLIANMTQLKVLNLESSEVSGQGFGSLENLTELKLWQCINFRFETFIDILKSNNLVKLSVGHFNEHSHYVDRMSTMTSDAEPKFLRLADTQICRLKTLREISICTCSTEYLLAYLKMLVKNQVPLENLEIYVLADYVNPVVMTSEIVAEIIQLENLRALRLRDNSGLVKMVKISEFCHKIEMLDVDNRFFSGCETLEYVENLKNLRYLNTGHFDNSVYHRLVEIRKQPGFMHPLVVYAPISDMSFEILRKYVEHTDMAHVQMSHQQMRSETDESLLERLEQLNQEGNLLALNDDCLCHLMQFLPLVDQLKLVLLNSCSANIMRQFLRTHPFKVAKFLANFTPGQIRDLLPRFGEMVRKLHITRPGVDFDAEFYDLAVKYFTNVVELHYTDENLSAIEQRPNYVELCRKIIIKSQDSLEALCIESRKVDDEFSSEISKAAKLHTLSLTSSKLTGVNLGNFTHLISLNLMNVNNLTPTSFANICKSNQLKNLNIIGCEQLNNESFQVIVETQFDLETLAIGENSAATNLHLVAELNNLKDLTLHRCTPEDLLQCTGALAALNRDQLTFLRINCQYQLDTTSSSTFAQNIAALRNLIYLRISESSAINFDFIRTIAEGCQLLKVLDVAGATNLTEEGVLEAIRLFKHLRHFGVNGCEQNYFPWTYRRALEIKKKTSRLWSLVLYTDRSLEIIEDLNMGEDYQFQVVKLSSEDLSQLNKYELIKEETLPRDKTKPVDPTYREYLLRQLNNLNYIARTFTISQAFDIFGACSGRIKRIEISMDEGPELIDYIKLLRPYCSYFESIDIDCNNIQFRDEVMLLFHAEDLKLKRLTIRNCLNADEVLGHLADTPNVSSIRFLDVGGSCLSGNYIAAFQSINYLTLKNCSNIMNEYFQTICNNLRLKSLNIIGVKELDDFSYEELIRTQNDHLKILSMSCQYAARNCTDVSKIQRLKHINIVVDVLFPEFENFLRALFRHTYHIPYIFINNKIPQNKYDVRFHDLIKKAKSGGKVKARISHFGF